MRSSHPVARDKSCLLAFPLETPFSHTITISCDRKHHSSENRRWLELIYSRYAGSSRSRPSSADGVSASEFGSDDILRHSYLLLRVFVFASFCISIWGSLSHSQSFGLFQQSAPLFPHCTCVLMIFHLNGCLLRIIPELYHFAISSSPRSPLFSCLGSKSSARPQNRQFAFLRSHTKLLWITNNGHSGNKMVLLAQLVHLQVTSINEAAKSSLEWSPSIWTMESHHLQSPKNLGSVTAMLVWIFFTNLKSFCLLARWVSGIFRTYLDDPENIQMVWEVNRW